MIGKLAKSIRQYLPATLLSPLCMVGEVYMEVQIPMVLSKIVDLGVEMGNLEAVWQYGLRLILCAIGSLLFGVASAVAASHAGTGFARNLRHDMFYRVQTFKQGIAGKYAVFAQQTNAAGSMAAGTFRGDVNVRLFGMGSMCDGRIMHFSD